MSQRDPVLPEWAVADTRGSDPNSSETHQEIADGSPEVPAECGWQQSQDDDAPDGHDALDNHEASNATDAEDGWGGCAKW